MLHLVVSRSTEDLAWLHQLPARCSVRIYNHGAPLDPGRLPEGTQVIPMTGGGASAASYLQHLKTAGATGADEHTVFTPGNPFVHAPAFLELLRQPHRWGDVQPLSIHGAPTTAQGRGIPPHRLAERDARDWIGAMAVRPERYSLCTWGSVHFMDEQAWRHAEHHRRQHDLPDGTNLAAHFYELCGLTRLAEDAADADIGLMAYGGVFAVRGRAIAALLADATPQLDQIATLCRADPHYPWVLERCWLHLFGLPYVRLEALARPTEAITPMATSLSRVVASIDALLARAEGEQLPQRARRVEAAAVAPARLQSLRDQARSALSAGDADRAMNLLRQAVQAAPQDVEVLADTAALAFQRGDLATAVPMARRALLLEPQHAASQFTLAMSLAALGEQHESLSLFDGLMHADSARGFRTEHPELAAIAARQSHHLLQQQQQRSTALA